MTWFPKPPAPAVPPAQWFDPTTPPAPTQSLAPVAYSGSYTDLINVPPVVPGSHAALSGLLADDHPQYYDMVRGDLRYSQVGHTHTQASITGLTTALAGKEPVIAAGTVGQYWRGDKTWQTFPSGGLGDVVGPASAVNNNFSSFDLTTGKLIKDSGVSAASFDAAGAAAAAQAAAIAASDPVGSAAAAQAAAIAASQPLDSDLTAIAALTTTANGRALLTSANALTIGASASVSGVNTGDQDLSGHLTIASAASTYAPLSPISLISYSAVGVNSTSTSLADVHSTAAFNIPSTGFYEFEFFITYTVPTTATGAFFSINGTATNDYFTCDLGYSVLATDRGNYQIGSYDGGVTSPSSISAGGSNCLMQGKINVTATGTLVLRFATETGGAAVTILTIKGFLRKLN